MSISSLECKHGAKFSGVFRIRQPLSRIAQNGSRYRSMFLEDATGSIKAYAWSENMDMNLQECDRAEVRGTIRSFNNEWIANILGAEQVTGSMDNALQLIPKSICPLPALLEQLHEIVKLISTDALRQFVCTVLADDQIAFPFVSAPASRQHHHCVAGGLLEHSLECAAMVSRFVEFPRAELELALVGALFHDIGKIRTMKSVGKLSAIGYVCDHESLTLEVLAPHLQVLDSICPDAAIALRYLWTWRNRRYQRAMPLLTVAEAIAAADRISSGLNVQEAAFRDQPDWKNFASYGTNNSFWRPRLALQAGG